LEDVSPFHFPVLIRAIREIRGRSFVAGAGRLLALTMAAAISYLPRRACRYGVAL
jgi:hypothetical protein